MIILSELVTQNSDYNPSLIENILRENIRPINLF